MTTPTTIRATLVRTYFSETQFKIDINDLYASNGAKPEAELTTTLSGGLNAPAGFTDMVLCFWRIEGSSARLNTPFIHELTGVFVVKNRKDWFADPAKKDQLFATCAREVYPYFRASFIDEARKLPFDAPAVLPFQSDNLIAVFLKKEKEQSAAARTPRRKNPTATKKARGAPK